MTFRICRWIFITLALLRLSPLSFANMDNPPICDKAPSGGLRIRFQEDVELRRQKDNFGMVVAGNDTWLFFNPELETASLPPEEVLAITNQIVHFHQALAQIGIEVIYAPIPTKWAVYPEKISDVVKTENISEVTRMDANRQKLLELLRAQGVTVVDLMPAFIEHKTTDPVFFKHDTHWSPAGAMIAARVIADVIKRRPWYRNPSSPGHGPLLYTPAGNPGWKTLFWPGDLRNYLTYGENKAIADKIPVLRNFLTYGGNKAIADKIPVEEIRAKHIEGSDSISRDSPVLIFGDSNVKGILPDNISFGRYLAYELGMKIDLNNVAGDGINAPREQLARLANIDPDYVLNKKIIVWTHSGRFLRKGCFKTIEILNKKLRARTDSKTPMPVMGQTNSLDNADKGTKTQPSDTGNALVLLGRIVTASNPPVPRREPYKDAITFTLYEVLEVENGTYPEKLIICVEWVMKGYKLLSSSRYKPGDVHRLTLVPYTKMENSPKVQNAMKRNNTDNYALEWYWATAVENAKAP